MKKTIVYVDCCRECPFSDRIGIDLDYRGIKFYCTHIDKAVDPLKIDEDCPLEDE